MKRTALVVLVALALAPSAEAKKPPACAFTVRPVVVGYDPEEVGTVEVEAFLKTRGGDVKTNAGEIVYLLPRAPEVDALLLELAETGAPGPKRCNLLAGNNLGEAIAAVQPTFSTRAGASGIAQFADVPAGDWYAVSFVYWEVPSAYSRNLQGGMVYGRLTAEGGKTVRAVATRLIRLASGG